MKKLFLALVVIALVIPSRPVSAQNGWYIEMDLGIAVAPGIDVKTGGMDDWVSSADATGS